MFRALNVDTINLGVVSHPEAASFADGFQDFVTR